MNIKKTVLFISTFVILICALSTKAIAQRQPTVNLILTDFVSATPDSVFKAKLDVFIGDSIEVHSLHIVVLNSSASVFDNLYVISNLPVISSSNAWKDGYLIHIDVPNVNPFFRKRYFVEFLSSTGQLLLQIEKEF